MFERLTAPAREAVVLARDEAGALGHDYVGSEHILLGLVREEEGVAAAVLKDMGVTLERARDAAVRIGRPRGGATAGQLPYTPAATKVLELALREVLAFSDPYVATPHVLLGLTRANDDVAERLLLDLGAAADEVGEAVLRLRPAAHDSWEESVSDEPVAAETHAASRRQGRRLEATSVRAAVEVALVAASTKATEDGRRIDLGDLLLALAEGWPDDLVAVAFAELGIDADRVRKAVEAARHE